MSKPMADARADWEARIATRSDSSRATEPPQLPAPGGLMAEPGVGQVTLRWQPVEGAVGYLVHRADAREGPFAPVDHLGGDVLSVPDTWYVDTTGEPGRTYHYAVASVPEVTTCGELGGGIAASSQVPGGAVPTVTLTTDAGAAGSPLHKPWQPMIGSERLSQLLCTDTSGGREIGTELFAALRRVAEEIGVTSVRAHAILHDDLGVYREVDGEPVYDFSEVDEVYDAILGIGLRPVVEIGFMPRDLASDPDRTVFEYGAIISPPKDWQRWGDLVHALVRHLVDRYGIDEVRRWEFEVWNEANLEVFWSGTRQEWMHLYDVTAFAVKDVDSQLVVGGPSSAAAGWVDELLAHVAESGAPLDFVSTHTYGSPPLDLRPTLARFGRSDAKILWTEWGVTPTHFNPVNDSASSAMFLLQGMRSSAGRLDALSYWVASDHFEELGRPPRLLHGGFGLLTVGGLAKARYHALWLLSLLGDTELPATVDGDGAGGLVQGWVSRRADGSLVVLVWNHTLDQSKAHGGAGLDRRIRLKVAGLDSGAVDGVRPATLTRLDREHGDISELAEHLGVQDWPTDTQWEQLAAIDALTPDKVAGHVEDGVLVLEFDLPQPGEALVEV
ncbi:GH39 family glycosyl hydrolase [Actinopolymorpha singaporensis]|uniref:Xylan 1,4-beta-xylosidase n=1 Tax=Actinopolymorpha singaporensis TaxID=117157 RepID=A0A1H1V1S0_9ACTN|nr:xylan 1,4-beta-xylosidase [Actinopolymorpha singaporensis]SDS78461.1 xylan 1,4-beta-xylosidase [Actinopolymorpha singaporensis]